MISLVLHIFTKQYLSFHYEIYLSAKMGSWSEFNSNSNFRRNFLFVRLNYLKNVITAWTNNKQIGWHVRNYGEQEIPRPMDTSQIILYFTVDTNKNSRNHCRLRRIIWKRCWGKWWIKIIFYKRTLRHRVLIRSLMNGIMKIRLSHWDSFTM